MAAAPDDRRDPALARLLAVVCAVVLVDTAFYSAVTPLLPVYADRFGLGETGAGIVAAAFPVGTLACSLPAGWVVARAGRRPTVVAGLLTMAVSSVAVGFAPDAATLTVARFVQGAGGALTWTGALAWLWDATPPARRASTLGTALGFGIAGALAGPVLGSLARGIGPEVVFGSAAVVGLALVGLALRLPVPPPGADGAAGPGAILAATRTRGVAAPLWLVILPALCFGAINVLAPLRLDALGAGGAVIGGAFLVSAGCEAAMSAAGGRVADRRGRLVPIRAGLAAAVALFAAFAVPGSAAVVVALVVGAGLVFGAAWAPAIAMLSDASEAAGLAGGAGFALVNLAWATGQGAGNLGAGALAEATSPAVPYALLAVAAAATAVALGALARRVTAGSGRAAPADRA